MKFPIIETINDLKPYVEGMEYIAEQKKSNGCTLFAYLYSEKDSFKTAFERECRGITFDLKGRIITRPFHKFFNVNEREETLQSKFDSNDLIAGYEKLDGSMVSGGTFSDGSVYFQSKQSFDSYVVRDVEKFLQDKPYYYDFVKNVSENYSLTPIFEYCGPENAIILHYKEPSLKLIGLRHLFTGEYFSLDEYALPYKIPVAEKIIDSPVSINYLIEKAKVDSGYEGVVLWYTNNRVIKLKTVWYTLLHKSLSYLRVRDVAEMILDDNLDDFFSVVNTFANTPDVEFDVNKVYILEKKINDDIHEIEHIIQSVIEKSSQNEWTTKELAQYCLQNYPVFMPLIMAQKNNKPYDVRSFYKKKFLKEKFSLDLL